MREESVGPVEIELAMTVYQKVIDEQTKNKEKVSEAVEMREDEETQKLTIDQTILQELSLAKDSYDKVVASKEAEVSRCQWRGGKNFLGWPSSELRPFWRLFVFGAPSSYVNFAKKQR